jgi:exodeoxyribonuclease VII large subunit
MQPAGAGNLMQQFEELKKKLDAEGLFAQEIKKSIPEQPKHIGVITSESTAALQDILSTIERRAPVSQVSLIPATVQGDSAPRTIISALQSVLNYNNLNNANAFDLILICRGGGSIEDLWAFNNESLAREMFDFPLPIISGVGHEIDFTITDFVADLRAPTPTAAAELATEYFFNLSDKLDETKSSMSYLIERKLNEKKQQISYASQNLKSPTTHLKEQSQSLDNIEIRISSSIKQTLGLALQSLQITKNQFLQSSALRRFERNEDLLTAKLQTLKYGFENTLKKRRFYLENLETKIQAVSPIAVLDRGYAIVMDEKGKALKSSKQLSAGSKISTRLAKGTFEANVTKTN